MPQRYVFSNRATRELRRLPAAVQARIVAALDRFVEGAAGADIRKLQGGVDE